MSIKAIRSRITNEEFILDVMNYSDQGGLIQLFVIEGLRHYSEEIIEADMSGWGKDGLINPVAWKNCAKEYLNKLENRYEHEKD